jgi:cobalt-zinc-cadmium efflux system membrane fusion protein
VTLGDRVREGQVLLTIETPEASVLQSGLRQARADVRQRQAALTKAEADVSRARDLLANRAMAQKDVLAAENELAVATAALEQARATEDDVTRRSRLFGVMDDEQRASATLRSPIGGEVIEIAASPGEYRSDTAAPVVAVADLSSVWVAASVPENALGRIQTARPVSVSVTAYPGQPFEGRITRIAGALDPQTRTVRVIAELDNRDRRLKPGMFARVRYTGPVRPVVTVAVGAIVQDEGRTFVFVERTRGEFERRDVVLGPRRGNDVVITSGLATSDRVLVDGTMLLMGR